MRRFVRRGFIGLWRNLPVYLMLQAVLWSLYAPWIDPAFAGRQPEHDHLYLGEVDVAHSHNTLAPKPHLHHQEETPPTQTDIVFLPNRDGSGQITAVLPPLFTLLGLQPNETFIKPLPENLYPLQGITIAPPEQPPRA